MGIAVDVYHVWWDPHLEREIERAGSATPSRLLAYHICDWLVPTTDLLTDRGMMGDGVIDLPLLALVDGSRGLSRHARSRDLLGQQLVEARSGRGARDVPGAASRLHIERTEGEGASWPHKIRRPAGLVAGADPRSRRRAAGRRAVRLRPGRHLRRAGRRAKGVQALSSLLVEVVTSWVTLGALVGSLAGGELADRLGRRKALLAAAALFAAGADDRSARARASRCWSSVVWSWASASASRRSRRRCTPRSSRPRRNAGASSSAYQLAITIGIFLSYLIDQALAAPATGGSCSAFRPFPPCCCCSR